MKAHRGSEYTTAIPLTHKVVTRSCKNQSRASHFRAAFQGDSANRKARLSRDEEKHQRNSKRCWPGKVIRTCFLSINPTDRKGRRVGVKVERTHQKNNYICHTQETVTSCIDNDWRRTKQINASKKGLNEKGWAIKGLLGPWTVSHS